VNSPYPEHIYIPCISEGVWLSFMTIWCHTSYVMWVKHILQSCMHPLHHTRNYRYNHPTMKVVGRSKALMWFTFWNHIHWQNCYFSKHVGVL